MKGSIISLHLPEGTIGKPRKSSVSIADLRSEIRGWDLPRIEQKYSEVVMNTAI